MSDLTISELEAAVIALGWEKKQSHDIESWQRISYWFNDVAPNIDIHLMIVEDLTHAQKWPELYMYTYETGWRRITPADITPP